MSQLDSDKGPLRVTKVDDALQWFYLGIGPESLEATFILATLDIVNCQECHILHLQAKCDPRGPQRWLPCR